MRQKVLLGSFKAIKFPLQSSPRSSRAVCSKNSHISSVSSADPYVVHACGYLVAIACRLSPWPTYRPLPCRMPLYPGQLPSFTAFHGPLSRFSGQPLLCPPCRSKASMPSGRLASRGGGGLLLSPVGDFLLFLTARKDSMYLCTNCCK